LAASAKGADVTRGVPLPEEQVERRRRTALEQDLGRNLILGFHGPWWSVQELALLGTVPDAEVARRTDRTYNAVRLVVLGGGAAAWWWQERTAVVRDVEAALAEAAGHQEAGCWPEVRAALERAEGRLGSGGPRALRERVQQARRDADMVAELDTIRLQ